jgi:hypothetical protein
MLLLITCAPSVSVIRSVFNTPAGVLHTTLLSDIHPVDSVDVCPTAPPAVCPYAPSPEPITTIPSPPGSITFDAPSTDNTPTSADTIPVTDPTNITDVTDTRLVPEIECEATKHITAVCDIHSDPSHPVCPTLTRTDDEIRLKEILQYNLKSVRAHLLRKDFQLFWEYTSPEWAVKCLDAWCTRTMRSRIGPMKKIAKSLRRHWPLILNGFRARGTISSGVVEGFNGKAKLTTRKAFGFRTPQGIEIALFHVLGRLPEPKFSHRFC